MSPDLPPSGSLLESPYRVRAVDRALDLLAEFADPYTELSLVQLTARSGLAKPTVYRLLATLCQRGFVEQAAGSRAYRLGRAYLGQVADASLVTHCDRAGFTANDACARRMQACAVATDAALGLSVRIGDRRVLIARTEPKGAPWTDPAAVTGASSPLWSDPAGWLLLAAMGLDAARSYIDRRGCEAPERGASWDGASADGAFAEGASEAGTPRAGGRGVLAGSASTRLFQRLERIRSEGWAEGPAQAEGGAAMVAAPVKDLRGRVVAALHTFTSEAGRGDAAALRAAVLQAARELSGDHDGPCGPGPAAGATASEPVAG